ncbi:DUF1707 domain-containing protein [Pseudonocardia kujensis]|uniref:DUF1707 SHOCT-like domain-containing protein n=1 Tax=Pseudonocardia kujensis TaxID=1128675 RepID=UPI001E42241E|nr:DUF1707 domain-containing protein [Pseudonocardia kujensis]MCE0761497.1 DUF1707 domain-containing protein [Pseudonocardia kujensis]
MSSLRTRARDADRNALCNALDTAYAEGQMDGAEHRERTATALRATTLGELKALVADLQLERPIALLPPDRPPRSRGARWAGVLVALALLGVGFGIGHAAGRSSAPATTTSGAVAAGAPVAPVAPVVVTPAGLHTPEGFDRLVGDLRARLGTAVVADATVYPDYAVLTVPVEGSPGRAQSYTYRGGLDGPSPAGTRDADQPVVDLATIDARTALGLVAGAPESLKVADPTSRYMIIDDEGEGPRIAVHASNDNGETGYLEARPDGSIIAVHPHEAI